MKKRRLSIEGYTISIPSKGYHTIMVLRDDGLVTEFEELNRAQYPVLISAFEADDSVKAYVVADCNGAYTVNQAECSIEEIIERIEELDKSINPFVDYIEDERQRNEAYARNEEIKAELAKLTDEYDIHKKTVFFIGSGYNAVKTVKVYARTCPEAFEKAEKLYKESGWTFHYCELELSKYEW